jgi:hypothetical protein
MSSMPGMSLAPEATPHLPPPVAVISERHGTEVTVNLTAERRNIEIAPGVV